MPWPQSTEYNAAIQNLRSSVSDDELRGGEPVVNALGIPIPFSGNFADVYKVYCPKTGNTWAVKCFTRESPGLKERYREISAHLSRARLPFTVDFRFVEPGIRIRGQWHPFLKMRWVEGFALNQFVADYVENRGTLKLLLPMWVKLSQMLRRADVAHCDLQHGNVLLVPASAAGALSLKLIDYDGMYVPSLSGRRSAELGHPSYQHPQRLREGLFGPEVDRFSHLAIYCAIRCLIAGGQGLWKRFNNGENLLFRETNHKDPGASEIFRHLWSLSDPDVHALVGRLALATRVPLDRVPLLEGVASNGSAVPLSAEEERTAEEILGVGRAGTLVSAPSEPAESDSGPEGPWWSSGAAELLDAELSGPLETASLDATPPELPALGVPRRRKRGRLGWSSLRSAMGSLSAAVRPIDGLLGRLAGEGNAIVHRFLRLAAVLFAAVVLALLVILASRISRPRPGSPHVATAEREITVDLGGGVAMEMVLIPAGQFTMGSPDSEPNADSDEKPQHQVRITRPFYLGRCEVTQEQWQAVMGANPSHSKSPSNPVEQVSCDDCQRFLDKLNEKYASTGVRFSLPTEAQWEYACRAGSTTRWCFGDDEAALGEYAWYRMNSFRQTHPVGQKRPNAWGLYDMHGNVWEWCADWYDGRYYRASPPDDPTGPPSGSVRVLRGGSWRNYPGGSRSALRFWLRPGDRDLNFGFRVARTHSLVPEVTETTEALRITLIDPQGIEVGKLLTVPLSVENAQHWQGKVTYSLGAEAPAGACIDPSTGSFTWTPTGQDRPGTYDIPVSVEAPNGKSARTSFTIVVTGPGHEETAEPTAGLRSPPSFDSRELGAALIDAHEAFEGRETGRGATPELYEKFSRLGRILPFVDSDGQGVTAARKRAAAMLLARLAADPLAVHEIGQLAVEPLEDLDGPDGGVLVAGTVGAIVEKDGLYAAPLKIPGIEATQLVMSTRPLSLSERARVLILGSTVHKPEERVIGYRGPRPMVIWHGTGVPVPEPPTTPPEPLEAGEGAEVVEDKPTAPIPVGSLISENQILLRRWQGEDGWMRVPSKSPLSSGDRLVALPTYRPEIGLADVTLQLLGGTEIELLPGDVGQVAGVNVRFGRMFILPLAQRSTQIRIVMGKHDGVLVFDDADTVLVLDAEPIRPPGTNPETVPSVPRTVLYTRSGDVTWTEGAPGEKVHLGPQMSLTIAGPAPRAAKPVDQFPDWVTTDTTSVMERQASSTLLKYWQAEWPASRSLVELTDFRRREVQWLATRSLGYIGRFEAMVDPLDESAYWESFPNFGESADFVNELRRAVARSPETAAAVRQALERDYPDHGALLYRMLWGYTADGLQEGEAASLVDFLDHDALPVRGLAFWNLRDLTGWSLYYEPADTAAQRELAVEKWRERLASGEIWKRASERR